ncbi:hypothetical protein LguiB_028383 [Lonicera macranthoides]
MVVGCKMFPIIDLKARPTAKPKIFAGLLWKQLNHPGTLGFILQHCNVVYYYADSDSPLAWDVDHWFRCFSNNILSVFISINNPNYHLYISINQLSSNFRHRAFSHLFLHGESKELNDSQTGEISKLDSEVNELRHKTEEEKVAIQTLELVLIKKEDALKSVGTLQRPGHRKLLNHSHDYFLHECDYKQQMRLNEVAASAIMARLEAQKAICDSSERELHIKFRQRDELETQIRPD